MAETKEHDHIRDTDTVFMQHPTNDGVGSCLGLAFKTVYAPQGYTQVSFEDWEAAMAKLNDERADFVASGRIAELPDGEPEAQTVINADTGAGRRVTATGDAGAQPGPGKHRGEG